MALVQYEVRTVRRISFSLCIEYFVCTLFISTLEREYVRIVLYHTIRYICLIGSGAPL